MISVFKTTVADRKGIKKIKPFLDELIPGSGWNFDLKDCDKILRINSKEAPAYKIIELLRSNGFDCEELE